MEVERSLVDFAFHDSQLVYRLRTLNPGLGTDGLREVWKDDLVDALGLDPWVTMDFRPSPASITLGRTVPLVGVLLPTYVPVSVSSYPPNGDASRTTEVLVPCGADDEGMRDRLRAQLGIPADLLFDVVRADCSLVQALDLRPGVAIYLRGREDASDVPTVRSEAAAEPVWSDAQQDEDEELARLLSAQLHATAWSGEDHFASRMQGCPVCLEDHLEGAMVELMNCTHFICRPCLLEYVDNQTKQGRNLDSSIRCMECPAALYAPQVEAVFESEGRRDDFVRLSEQWVLQTVERRRCPACQGGYVLREGQAEPTTVVCPNAQCRTAFCPRGCRNPHPNATCLEAQSEAERQQTEELVRTFPGRGNCPRCGEFFTDKDKDAACDRVTCTCQHRMCWLCLAPHAATVGHDNMWHAEGCEYFQPHTEAPVHKDCCPPGGICPRPPPLSEEGRARMQRIQQARATPQPASDTAQQGS